MPMTRNCLRAMAMAMALPILAATLAFLPATSAWADQVLSTGQFQSFGGSAGKCLDVQFAGTAPGTPLDSGNCNGTDAQDFTLITTQHGPGYLLRASVGSNMCVSVPDGVYNGSPAELEPCNDTNINQNWEYWNGVILYGANESYCLDVLYGNTGQDIPIDVSRCNLTNAQLWWPAGYKAIVQSEISGGSSALCLDDYANAVGRVDSFPCNYGTAQTWYTLGDHTIRNVNGSTLVAGQPDPSSLGTVTTVNGTNYLWSGVYWNIQYSSPSVRFVNGFTGPYGPECLDVQGASPAANTTVDLWRCNGTVAQQWNMWLAG